LTEEEYRKAINAVIYLSGCAVNGTIPDKKLIEGLDTEQLRKAANKHFLTAIVCYALETAGIQDNKLYQAKMKSIRKISAMEIDKKQLFERMEQEKIWYMPLKGTVIKEMYPSLGLRQMSDFDILFDKEYAENVRDIMLDLGFTCEHFGKGNHDVYLKQPVSNFEMHTELFFKEADKAEIYEYYKDIKRLLIKDDDNNFGYHFRNEDLYIYLTAHEYKHYSDGGTGLRSLLDTYVFWQKYAGQLDKEYISAETKKLGISDFEQQNCSLALHLFGDGELTKQDRQMLEYMIYSGTYGTFQNSVENGVKKNGGGKKGKMAYVKDKLFLPLDIVKENYPFYYKHKALLPVLFFYRIGKAVTVRKGQTKKTLKILKDIK